MRFVKAFLAHISLLRGKRHATLSERWLRWAMALKDASILDDDDRRR